MKHEQKVRYSRNISLSQIGQEGQNKLLSSKVLVIGAGGLGCPALLYLASCGIGHLGICDNDRAELSNLQRQVLFETSDIGEYKAKSAKLALHDLNPDINITCYNERLNPENVNEIIKSYDVILDGSDNIETRLLLNDICYEQRKPLISAAIHQFTGHLYIFKAYQDGDYPCYRCIFPNIEGQDMPSCSESGILGSVAGTMGTLQATEAIKELLKINKNNSQNIIIYDALKSEFRKIKARRNKGCVCCG